MEFKRKTIEKDEEYLRQISTDVDFKKDDITTYVKHLKNYFAQNTCYALAPVQIGIPKRIIYIKNSSPNMDNNNPGYDESLIYINPVIVEEKGLTKFLEGCESCIYYKNNEKIYYTGIVERPYSIKVEYYDLKGEKQEKTITGFEATVFCHEYDHLNGILHMDRIKDVWEMRTSEMREYRLKHPYEIICKEKGLPRLKTGLKK